MEPTLEHLTSEVRRILRGTENDPVGVMTAYRNAILRLADAVDRLAGEIDAANRVHHPGPSGPAR
jgi:hypothetical protein